jgi:hypothetical protein
MGRIKQSSRHGWMRNSPYGFAQSDWDAGKTQAFHVMANVAKSNRLIRYKELVIHVTAVKFPLAEGDPKFWHMLGEISVDEETAGRGMLSAVVVNDQFKPGKGSFDLACELDRDLWDKDRCWLDEIDWIWKRWRVVGDDLPSAPGRPLRRKG